MSIFSGDFGNRVSQQREVLTNPPRKDELTPGILDAETLAKRKKARELYEAAKTIAALALQQEVPTDTSIVEVHRDHGPFGGARQETEIVTKGWLVVVEENNIGYSTGLERSVSKHVPVFVYNGVLLATTGELVFFNRTENVEEIEIAKVGILDMSAGGDWKLSDLNDVHTRTRDIEAIEVNLANFVVRHGLDGQPPVAPGT